MDTFLKAQKLEELLEKNIALFLERGGTLVCREYGNKEENKACALNTIAINDDLNPSGIGYQMKDLFFNITGVSYSDHELFAFIRGFDSFELGTYVYQAAFYELGQRLRDKYLRARKDNI